MADIAVRSNWIVQLDTTELRLVLKALGGRLKEEEIVSAKTLGDRLTKLRAEATRVALAQADGTLKALGDSHANNS